MGSLENFVLAEIDIFPVIEELIDLIGNSMGQAWVDTQLISRILRRYRNATIFRS